MPLTGLSLIWQIVPMAALREAASKASAAGDRVTVEFSAAFNQRAPHVGSGARNPAEELVAGNGAFAFSGSATDVRRLWHANGSLGVASASLTEILDEDPDRWWRRLQITISLPEAADFLLLQCDTGDDKGNSVAVFDGQFVDDIRCGVVVEAERSGGGK